MPTPGPTIERRSEDDAPLSAELEAERDRSAALLSELEQMKRSRDALSVARVRTGGSVSIDPGPMSSGRTPSMIPSVLRAAGPWAPAVILVGVGLWALGGGEGLAKVVRAWQGQEQREREQALVGRVAALEAQSGRLRAALVESRDDEIAYREAVRQVLGRQGVQWEAPEGSPPPRALRVTVPLRRPGVVTKGPTLIVDTPMPLPPAAPSAGQ